MRIYRLPHRPIDRFGSTGVDMTFLPHVEAAQKVRVHVATIAAGGTLGEHPATGLQVFAVTAGTADVKAGTGDAVVRRLLTAGHAAVWQPGEVHQTWARTDVVATVLEVSAGADLGLDDHFEDVTDR